MIQSLYEPFKKWSEKGSVWLISDPHFDDEDTKLMNPNWIDPDDYIKILNDMIHKNDTLICLGDCGNIDRFKELKVGYKVLIKGNHDDRGDSKYQKSIYKYVYDADKYTPKYIRKQLNAEFPNAKISMCESYEFHLPFHRWNVQVDSNLFDEVYSGALFISPQILLSHEPIYGLKFCTNIHGHEHNGTYDYTDKEGGRHAVAQQLRTNREIDTCITNISYRYVWDMVNDLYKEYDVDFEKLLLEKIKGIIDGLTSYSVFREANAYGDKITVGQEMFNKIVEDSRPQIEQRVIDIINNYDFKELKEEISDTIYDCIWSKFKSE